MRSRLIICVLICFSSYLRAERSPQHVSSCDVRIEIHSPTKITETIKKTYVILSAGDEVGKWSHFYDNFQKVTDMEARFTSLSGKKIKALKRKDATDELAYDGFSVANDTRVVTLDLHHHSYPYILETTVSTVYSSLIYISSSQIQNYDQQVDKYTYRLISHTPDVIPELRCHNLPVEICDGVQRGRDITYKFTDLQAIAYENHAPSYWNILPRLTVSFGDFSYGNYTGDHTSWESFGEFMATLNEGRQELPPDLSHTIDTLTAGLDLRSQVHSVYRYLQDHHRYVSIQLGVGGWQTFDVKDVHRTGSGDCKALSNYMVSALKHLGIESHYTLIYTRDHLDYPDDFFANRFNHAIVYVPALDEWYECTSSTMPAGYLGADNYNKTVLSVVDGKGVKTSTSEWDYRKNQEKESINIKLAEDGSATISTQLEYRGSRSEYWNYHSHYRTGNKLRKLVKSRIFPSCSHMDDPHIVASRVSPHVEMQVSAESLLYAKKSGDRIFVPINAFFPSDHQLSAETDRKYDLIIRDGYVGELKITIELPSGYEVESLGKGENIDSPYGNYISTIKAGDGKVTFERKLSKYPVHVSASDYSDVRDFYKQLYKADTPTIVLVRKRT